MTFVGNHGVCVTEIQKDGKTYYVCNNGVEFCYFPTAKKLISNDGTEYIINEEFNMLICNNGNDAKISVGFNNKRVVEFLDGTTYTEL